MKKKLNKKGFALVETLVCAMFVAIIFTIMFENYYPLIAKYRKAENYDDIDSKYITYYVRDFLYENYSKSDFDTYIKARVNANNCADYYTYPNPGSSVNISEFTSYKFDSESITTSASDHNRNKIQNTYCDTIFAGRTLGEKNICTSYFAMSHVTEVFILNYRTSDLKTRVKQPNANYKGTCNRFSRAFENYVDYLPTYTNSNASKNPGGVARYYRMIVEIEHQNEDKDKAGDYYYTYSELEIDRNRLK